LGTGLLTFHQKWLQVTAAAERSRVNKTFGIILIVLGLFGLAWGGFTYTTTEKLVDIGPIHATREKTHDVPLPPIAGAVALIGGVVLLVAGRKPAAS
jgi:drug/metabolite transporter (DMT)-like permease